MAAKTRETWKTISRSTAVIRVLEQASEPLTPGEVAQTLTRKGREDVVNIHQTLSNLQKRDKVANVERGLWTVKGAPTPKAKKTPKAA